MEHIKPEKIENKSFEIITEELARSGIVINGDVGIDPLSDEPVCKVIKRCIHTTADFDYARTMFFSDGAIRRFEELILEGATIVTDTNMALSGINKKALGRFGCSAFCFMADEEVAKEAKERELTRAHVSMERAMKIEGPVIFVVGNAPTALITLKEHYDSGKYTPSFVIGVPVGFVNVESAKEMIMGTDIPYIINRGRKGGSNVAAAIVNALLYDMQKSGATEAGGSHTAPRAAGFTTGTCAAAAAKAAALMLLERKAVEHVSVTTPSGEVFNTPLEGVMLTKTDDPSDPKASPSDMAVLSASCAVRKPLNNDPDVTAGILIYARASFECDDNGSLRGQDTGRVIIEGGPGIGIVTKPGLDQPVGFPAINSVPRRMIEHEVGSVMDEFGYRGNVRIVISAPEGEEIAAKTFNSRLGIEGGISIIGTSGLVEPMSTKAIVDTIRVELRQKKALGEKIAVVAPGNYGMDFMRERFGLDLDRAVKSSNYIGETIDIAVETGFSRMLLVGHIGKLVKLAGGMMNTHHDFGDCRMELMAAAAIKCGGSAEMADQILECVSTDEAYRIMTEAGIAGKCSRYMCEKIMNSLARRAGDMEIGCIMYSNVFGIICESENAREMMKEVNIK